MNIATFVPSIPASLSERLIWRDNSFHASEELKGDNELDTLFAQCARELDVIVVPCIWYAPRAFEKKFGMRFNSKEEVNNATVENIVKLLKTARELKASDIHITYWGQYTSIEFRILGLLRPYKTLSGPEGMELISAFFQSEISQSESNFTPFEQYDARIADRKFLPEDVFAIRLHSGPIQSPYIPEPGVFVAIRLLFDATSAQGTLEQRLASLGYSPEQQYLIRMLTERSGLSIIAGATGHGKSTVLKNIMESLIEQNPTKNYMTMEDPPEFAIRSAKQRVIVTKSNSENERKLQRVSANASLLRSDPDVLMIGEIRYLEMAFAAIEAAMTGHGVWTTLHASSAFGILSRLRGLGVKLEDLYEDNVLNGLVYQRLMPILCPHCKKPLDITAVSPQLRQRLEQIFPSELDNIRVKGPGCSHCGGMGLSGLQVVAEVVPINIELITLLREKTIREAQHYWLKNMGGTTHVHHARKRVAAGEVDPAIAEERLGTTLDHDLKWQKEFTA